MKKFKFRSIFSALFNSYIIMLCIPILLSLWLIFLVDNLYNDKYIREMQESITQGTIILDKRLEYLDTKSRSLIFDFKLKGILNLPSEEFSSNEISKIRTFQKHLENLYIDSYYDYDVILENEYIFTNGNVVFGKEFFYNKYRGYEKLSFDKWHEKSFSNNKNSFLESQKTLSHGQDNIVTYVTPIFSGYINDEDIVASVQILLKEDELDELLKPVIGLTDFCVLLISNDEIVYRYTNNEFNVDEQIMEFMKSTNDDEGYTKLKADKGVELVYKKSSIDRYTLVMYTPTESIRKEVNSIRILIFIFLILSTFIEISLGIYFARTYSEPLRNIILNIQKMLGTSDFIQYEIESLDTNSDEYNSLNIAVNQLMLNSNNMKNRLKESQIKENRSFFRNVLLGNLNNEDIISKFNDINVDVSIWKSFFVATIISEDLNNVLEKVNPKLEVHNILFSIIMEKNTYQ